MAFRVSRLARDHYRFDPSFFTDQGTASLSSFRQARAFAQQMNNARDLARFPDQSVSAGQINAMALITEILRDLFSIYLQQKAPQALSGSLEELKNRLGSATVDSSFERLADEFPPAPVYTRETTPGEYLEGRTGALPHRQLLVEETLILWLSNANPAFSPYRELFDDTSLSEHTDYPEIISQLQDYFSSQPQFGATGQGLIDLLRAPALASPHSLSGQLEFMLERWGPLLGGRLLRLLSGLDLIKEEERLHFPPGPGPSRTYDFRPLEAESERFSPDDDWMPRVVVMAKNTYVWLDQLSRQYGREIRTLDQIPDEELDTLARRGFSGLWLIGLWERSPASREIKQRCGNPDAVSSAYSLFDYSIADDLGGESACESLRTRAWQRGIRLASDMVPNHMGIDSKWLIQHPDWFVSLDYSPFPSYTFSGEDLIRDERVSIYLEDHYYNRSDAAVVFKRTDRWTGSDQYVYHGNDGTSMPWNDTAQLNYLNAEVREAVIQTILHVARQFPIIRFDAAMTLARQHYQRLWFPQPGHGGAIPSRAEHGLTKEQFDALMPQEFWREVVDRVAAEAPGTLLLAEAFWMMEGYFVRTLGMHRVYNSAFMNMLRDEENAKYRIVIKNTVEFDPEILKRYVNFLNNPDESTAVAQFGKSDKYIGVCLMMVTMPGLPMFGHGQVEGYGEKYGMEYRRGYWDETPDPELVARHEREIFPLIHRRPIFSGVENFLLYDCWTEGGGVNEDVFAYSNRFAEERGLILYHNRFAEARGWIRMSAAYIDKKDGATGLRQKSLGEGLGITRGDTRFCVLRDEAAGLEYIRHTHELWDRGLFVSLGAYRYQVFTDIREMEDDAAGSYASLARMLDGRGVPSIREALREILLAPVLEPFASLVNGDSLRSLIASTPPDPRLQDEIAAKTLSFLTAARELCGGEDGEAAVVDAVTRELEIIGQLRGGDPGGGEAAAPESPPFNDPGSDTPALAALYCWTLVHRMGAVAGGDEWEQQSRSWIDEWRLDRPIARALQDIGLDEGAARRSTTLIKALTAHQGWPLTRETPTAKQLVKEWLADEDVRTFLGVNEHESVLWLNHESFVELLGWMGLIAQVQLRGSGVDFSFDVEQRLEGCRAVLRQIEAAEAGSEYRLDQLLGLDPAAAS